MNLKRWNKMYLDHSGSKCSSFVFQSWSNANIVATIPPPRNGHSGIHWSGRRATSCNIHSDRVILWDFCFVFTKSRPSFQTWSVTIHLFNLRSVTVPSGLIRNNYTVMDRIISKYGRIPESLDSWTPDHRFQPRYHLIGGHIHGHQIQVIGQEKCNALSWQYLAMT